MFGINTKMIKLLKVKETDKPLYVSMWFAVMLFQDPESNPPP